MAYLSLLLLTSIAVAAHAFRTAPAKRETRDVENLLTSSSLLESRTGCSPVQAVFLCKASSGPWSVADKLSGLSATDKKCLSQLCDKKGKTQCCEARNALLQAGVPPEEFQYADDAAIRMPTKPTPSPTKMPTKPKATTCSKGWKNITFNSGRPNEFVGRFDLPDTLPGDTVDFTCGEGAANPEQRVTFMCVSNLGDIEWSSPSSICGKDLTIRCPARTGVDAAKVQVNLENDLAESTSYYFELPEQTNIYRQEIVVEAKCPTNSVNPNGVATYICDPSGEWSYKNETCSTPASLPVPICYRLRYELTADGVKYAYNLDKGKFGDTKIEKCSRGKMTEGEILFECKEVNGHPRWDLVSDTCRAP